MMTSHLWLFGKRIKSKLVTSCVLSLSLAVTPVALAEYNPPPDQPPPKGNTSSSGPRGGCAGSEGRSLTVLAPQKHVGQTASVHPTFVWFVPDTKSFPMEFRLFELTGNNSLKVVQKLELKTSQGIMKLSLPQDKPGLTVGQQYLWQVTIFCNPDRPSSALVARAEIQVVEMPSTLKSILSSTTERPKRVELYAKAGYWYDALGEALGAVEGSRLGEVASTLLEELAKLEEAQQSANLSQIASSER